MKSLSNIEISIPTYNKLQEVIRNLYGSKEILDNYLNSLLGSNLIPEDSEFLNQVRLRILELINYLETF